MLTASLTLSLGSLSTLVFISHSNDNGCCSFYVVVLMLLLVCANEGEERGMRGKTEQRFSPLKHMN